MSRGFTLLELVVTLTLMSVVVGACLPAARRAVDRSAVIGAREAIVGMVVQARSEALGAGGARVILDGTSGVARLESSRGVVDRLDLAGTFRVRLEMGSSPRAELAFDGLGIGRLASRTLEIRRGAQSAVLVVSSHGRVSRR